MKKKLLITRNIPVCDYRNWQGIFEVDMPMERYSREEYLERAVNAHYIIACQQKVDRELLATAPGLIAVNSYGVGYDAIDVASCEEAGVSVTNTPTAVTEATAELAMGLLLALARRIPNIDRKMRNGSITWGILENSGTSLYGKKVGVVGLGRIGKAFAIRARAMGMQVWYHNRTRLSPEEEHLLQVSYLPLEDLFRNMDVISLHTPLSKSSYHLVDETALGSMKQSALLINTARGKVVDEQALVEALESGRIGGAGLDVFEHEPKVHPGLIGSEHTVLMPHVGVDTLEVFQNMFCEALDGFMALEEGRRPVNII